jgi:hypothetical protein
MDFSSEYLFLLISLVIAPLVFFGGFIFSVLHRSRPRQTSQKKIAPPAKANEEAGRPLAEMSQLLESVSNAISNKSDMVEAKARWQIGIERIASDTGNLSALLAINMLNAAQNTVLDESNRGKLLNDKKYRERVVRASVRLQKGLMTPNWLLILNTSSELFATAVSATVTQRPSRKLEPASKILRGMAKELSEDDWLIGVGKTTNETFIQYAASSNQSTKALDLFVLKWATVSMSRISDESIFEKLPFAEVVKRTSMRINTVANALDDSDYERIARIVYDVHDQETKQVDVRAIVPRGAPK